jgi:hypothetical protein
VAAAAVVVPIAATTTTAAIAAIVVAIAPRGHNTMICRWTMRSTAMTLA